MENNDNKRLAINIIANIVAFAVNFVISFFLTPYIVETVGKEAYGFVSLGNNFVNYASLMTVAINSMASRFITIKMQRKEYDSVSKYFSSILITNIIICFITAIPLALIVVFMQNIVNVPKESIVDIKILWTLLFLNFAIDLVSNVFAIATFAKNRIDLSAKKSIEGYFIKAAILLICYKFFNPYVFYIGLATIIYSVYMLIANIRFYKKLMPEIKIEKKLFDKKCIKELTLSGIWNTISRVGSIALTELDLLLSNLLIDASAMGIMSLVKTIPNYVVNLTSTITNAFMPNLTIAYAKAKEDKAYMVGQIRKSIRILLLFHSIIYGILIAYSDIFYGLWLDSISASEIQYMYFLGIISIGGCFISAVSYVMTNIFTIFNKLKLSSITVIATGFISSILTFIVVKNTSLGLIAIAGVSVVLVVIRNIAILMPYAAKCVGIPWYSFYKDMALNIFVIAYSVIISFALKSLVDINSWLGLIIICMIDAFTILGVNIFVLLRKEERKSMMEKIRNKIRRVEES